MTRRAPSPNPKLQLSEHASPAARRLGRRRWMQLAAASLSLPTLEIFAGSGAAAAPPTRRPKLLIYHNPNGREPAWWVPSAQAGGGLVFPEESKALQPYGRRALSLRGLSNKAALASPGAAHAMGTGTLLTSTAIANFNGVLNGISVDQAIAKNVDFGTRFSSLQWSTGEPGPCDVGNAPCAYTQCVSWAGKAQPLAAVIDPRTAFDQLFAAGADGLSGARGLTRKESLGSVLDFLSHEDADLRAELGRADQKRLDEYLTAVRSVERTIKTDGSSCSSGAQPAEAIAYPERVEVFHDLMVLALSCEQTSVLSFMIEFDLSGRSHPFIDVNGGHHALSHDGSAGGRAQLQRLETWYSQKVASLLAKMEATATSDGRSLLDDTVVLVIPSMGLGNSHDHGNNASLLVGGKDVVRADGRALDFGGASLANLHVTLLKAFGVDDSLDFGAKGARFGDDGDRVLDGVLV